MTTDDYLHLTHVKVAGEDVSVFYTRKNRVVKIVHSSSEVVLRTTKHTIIYPGLGLTLEVIAIRPMA
jgi:hypothetical protein